MQVTDQDLTQEAKQAMTTILEEHVALFKGFDFQELQALIEPIQKANSIFLIGMGRSGMMMQALAMRLMHLGFKAYVVGETTTPAIQDGDLLIAGSGSGSTATVLRAAQEAVGLGAEVASFTTDTTSKLAQVSTYVVHIPASEKQAHADTTSVQYAGSLFEQALLLFSDALIHTLWQIDGSTAQTLYTRHSNLE